MVKILKRFYSTKNICFPTCKTHAAIRAREQWQKLAAVAIGLAPGFRRKWHPTTFPPSLEHLHTQFEQSVDCIWSTYVHTYRHTSSPYVHNIHCEHTLSTHHTYIYMYLLTSSTHHICTYMYLHTSYTRHT
jgi:hypothetical protein